MRKRECVSGNAYAGMLQPPNLLVEQASRLQQPHPHGPHRSRAKQQPPAIALRGKADLAPERALVGERRRRCPPGGEWSGEVAGAAAQYARLAAYAAQLPPHGGALTNAHALTTTRTRSPPPNRPHAQLHMRARACRGDPCTRNVCTRTTKARASAGKTTVADAHPNPFGLALQPGKAALTAHQIYLQRTEKGRAVRLVRTLQHGAPRCNVGKHVCLLIHTGTEERRAWRRPNVLCTLGCSLSASRAPR